MKAWFGSHVDKSTVRVFFDTPKNPEGFPDVVKMLTWLRSQGHAEIVYIHDDETVRRVVGYRFTSDKAHDRFAKDLIRIAGMDIGMATWEEYTTRFGKVDGE